MIVNEASAAGSTEQVRAIAKMLGEGRSGLGRPIGARAAWEALARKASFARAVPDAEALLDTPLPAQPDELCLEYSRTGNRTRWEEIAGKRRGRVRALVLAECLENRGRFLPALAEVIRALCAERTWVMPAHDPQLTTFTSGRLDIDLGAAMLAWELASADWLLGDRIEADVRRLLRDNLLARVLDPFRAIVEEHRRNGCFRTTNDNGSTIKWWLLCNNNWNSVCLAGVIGTALAMLDAQEDRAFYVDAAGEYVQNFLRGFTADGYCSEGLGYWNYGFGHYVFLAEVIRQATAGRIDWLRSDEARMPARFPLRIELANGVFPAFADCPVNARPDTRVVAFICRCLGLEELDPAVELAGPGGMLCEALVCSFPNASTEGAGQPAAAMVRRDALRSWFDDAGVLICRPDTGVRGRFAVALKGGNNGEHHNHNDVGSFVVAVDKHAVILDAGGEVYTARTFSARRYESQALSSFGHPVPRVAGALQRTGADACARVLRTEFRDAQDTIAFDLRPVYDVAGLEELQRTFVYSRQDGGSLTVQDTVRFSAPQAFETALITLGDWRREGDTLIVTAGDVAVRIRLAVTGSDFDIQESIIREEMRTPAPPRRIALVLRQPVTVAQVTMTITPER